MSTDTCCSDIIEAKTRVAHLEEWLNSHENENNKALEKIDKALARIDMRLTSWVNPVLAIVISFLTAVMGLLSGALWVALK